MGEIRRIVGGYAAYRGGVLLPGRYATALAARAALLIDAQDLERAAASCAPGTVPFQVLADLFDAGDQRSLSDMMTAPP
jgi:hypothetical protein